MYSFSYTDIMSASPAEHRVRENQALQKSIELLNIINVSHPNKIDIINACNYNKKLWNIFIEDLVHPENELSADLKKSILSIGFWVLKEIQKIEEGTYDNITGLIEILEIVRSGLA